MRHISIIGIGMSRHTITEEALAALREAEVLFGAPRMLEEFSGEGIESISEYKADPVCRILEERPIQSAAVLVSGDPGFFSAAARLSTALSALPDTEVTTYAGLSSLNYFFAKLGRSWQEAALVSRHGRHVNLVDTVRRNACTFSLTGGNMETISDELTRCGFGELTVTVGENLGSDTERIFSCTAEELAYRPVGNLSVLLIDNPAPDDRVRTGIPDDEFIRGSLPMTKSGVRSLVMSKLGIRPDDTVYDIGAGTGSVTVECALAAWRGTVYAIEREPEGITLIDENAMKFHLGNVTRVQGTAPDAMSWIPAPDAAFIGGSKGKMKDIVQMLVNKNPNVRIVITAIAIESIGSAMDALKDAGIEAEITQISAAHSRPAGKLHLMTAENPIFIISGQRPADASADTSVTTNAGTSARLTSLTRGGRDVH